MGFCCLKFSKLQSPILSGNMRIILLAFIALFSIIYGASGQKNITISGTMKDAESGETLIGAYIDLPGLQTGASTNQYGFYTLSIAPTDTVTIVFSYLGYQSIEKTITAKTDTKLNITLSPSGKDLQEVVIQAESYKDRINSTQMSVEKINVADAKLLPALFGEVDIIKTIQLKPGIQAGSEGSSGLFVRGGNLDQNLIILDEALVYNANHLFGFFSTFNSDALKDVQVYKGGFPAEYGGRLSSVIDVKLREGNNQKFKATGGIGLITSRLTLEGPIIKNKASFMISARRTYIDLITNQINKANEKTEDYNPIPAYNFYDLNAKVNYQISDKDHLYLSGYFGRDVFKFNSDNFNFLFDWGNSTGTARWNHIFGPSLFANTTFTYSNYQYNIKNSVTGFDFSLGSQIEDVNLKTDMTWRINNANNLKFGVNGTYHEFTVGRLKAGSDNGSISFQSGQTFFGTEYGAYVSEEYEPNNKFKLTTGLRLSGFYSGKNNYFRPEPRISAKYSLTERLSVKGSYARMVQYVHLVSNSGISLPTDVWYPSTKIVKPEISDQIATGLSYLLGKGFLVTNEYYYKHYNNLVDFVDFARLFANNDLEQEFTFGKGYGYGTELSIEKNEGKLTGWIGYTLAWVKRGEFSFMDGRYFSPRYDRRHNLTVVGVYKINKRFNFTWAFIFGNGDKGWLPQGRFFMQDVGGAPITPIVPVYGERNTFQMPDYHRLDLGFVVNFFHKWGSSDLTLSIYNVYNRRNAYMIYLAGVDSKGDEITGGGSEVPVKVVAKQVSLFPILPALTWNFKFH